MNSEYQTPPPPPLHPDPLELGEKAAFVSFEDHGYLCRGVLLRIICGQVFYPSLKKLQKMAANTVKTRAENLQILGLEANASQGYLFAMPLNMFDAHSETLQLDNCTLVFCFYRH